VKTSPMALGKPGKCTRIFSSWPESICDWRTWAFAIAAFVIVPGVVLLFLPMGVAGATRLAVADAQAMESG